MAWFGHRNGTGICIPKCPIASEYWIEQYNDVVTMNPQFLEDDPAAGLLAAMTKVREEGLDHYELAMRAWADRDPLVSEAVRNVYEQRTKFIRGFFNRLGFRGLEFGNPPLHGLQFFEELLFGFGLHIANLLPLLERAREAIV